MPDLSDIASFDLVYVATPYTKYPSGIEAAFQAASRLMGALVREGVACYSPIVHTHPIAIYGEMDPLNHNLWLRFDEAMMRKSDAILVAKMNSWESSKGIAIEIEIFQKAGKPVFYLDPETMRVSTER